MFATFSFPSASPAPTVRPKPKPESIISNNTGPAHMAAALGTPVVDLYALTNPQHTPWQVPSRVLSHDVPCRWCYSSVCRTGHHLCLRGVAPVEVAR